MAPLYTRYDRLATSRISKDNLVTTRPLLENSVHDSQPMPQAPGCKLRQPRPAARYCVLSLFRDAHACTGADAGISDQKTEELALFKGAAGAFGCLLAAKREHRLTLAQGTTSDFTARTECHQFHCSRDGEVDRSEPQLLPFPLNGGDSFD
jgi:hypothetical protein